MSIYETVFVVYEAGKSGFVGRGLVGEPFYLSVFDIFWVKVFYNQALTGLKKGGIIVLTNTF